MDIRMGCVGEGDNFQLVVDLERVRDALVIGLNAVVEHRGRFLAAPHDEYWQLVKPDLEGEPAIVVASLVDDYDEGGELLDLPADEIAALARHSLQHLGNLLSVLWELDGLQAASPQLIAESRQHP
jgi:hypothetical protein